MVTLSPRQAEVLRLIAEGLSTPQIAARMGCATGTVATHRRMIGMRLGVRGMAQMIRAAIALGLIQQGERNGKVGK